jgi:hypothetical protein
MWQMLAGIDWALTGAIVVAIGGALKILDHFFGWIGTASGWVINLVRLKPGPNRSHLPKQTLILLPAQQHTPFSWHLGKQRDQPSMQVSAHVQVTNIVKGDILLSGARLRKPSVRGQILGGKIVEAGGVAEVMMLLWIQPPIKKPGEVLIADVCILDQFGNEHWLKKAEFLYK